MLFVLNMYHDLKDIKGEAEVSAGSGTRIFWWIVTVFGLALPIIGNGGRPVGHALWRQQLA